jgi:hypothetical protein
MRTDGATQATVEAPILHSLIGKGVRSCAEIISSIEKAHQVPPEWRVPRGKRSGEPQFHLIVRNSLEDGRAGNLLARGLVERVDHDQYRATGAATKRLEELEAMRRMLDDLFD